MKNIREDSQELLINTGDIVNILIMYQNMIVNANRRIYFLFTILVSLLALYIFKYYYLTGDFLKNGLYFFALFVNVFGLGVALWEIMPKKPKTDNKKPSLIFYASLKTAEYEAIKNEIMKKLLTNKNEFINDIIVQCIELSKILEKKYSRTTWVVWSIFISSFFIGVLLILNMIKH
ncbi:Pycsar system effector family protein [Caminibacter sp.]